MLLNRIFIGMFFSAILLGLFKLIFWGDITVFATMVESLFSSASTGFELSLYLTGALCLWMGFMQVGEEGGAINILSRAVAPLFSKLFPEIPKDHPAVGSMMMNFSANMLGLDNAATPLGLKAMGQLQELNPKKDTASNAQIMFLVLNTSGLTIIPVSILAYRAAAGSSNPSEVFLPILFATFFSTLVGLLVVGIRQKINLLNTTVLLYIGTLTAAIVSLLVFITYKPEYASLFSKVGGNILLFSVVIFFFILAVKRKINVYDSFIEGAKGGFKVAINIVPYLVAILAAIAVFRASGAMDIIMDGIKQLLFLFGISASAIIDSLPVAIMKPFSGSGARGLMLETFSNFGVDSFQGKLAATFQGSTETTFYVLAVYFGSVKVTKTRYAAGAGILADLAGIIAAIVLSLIFYTNG